MTVFDQLIKHRPENLVTGNVLAVDHNGHRARVRVQGESAIWASCSISVAVNDVVIIHNASRAVLQKLSAPAATQITLLLV